jgi:hypothetical protein
MAKEKAVNYTEAQVARLKEVYTGADNKAEVEALATELGKSPASVRAKLSSEGLYKTVEKAEKTDKVTKRAIVEAIGVKVELKDHEMDGLEKATKAALEKILAKLA